MPALHSPKTHTTAHTKQWKTLLNYAMTGRVEYARASIPTRDNCVVMNESRLPAYEQAGREGVREGVDYVLEGK